MHAGWNAMVKGSADKAIMLGMVLFAHLIVGLTMVAIFQPPEKTAWPYLFASVIVHSFYVYFLFLSYRLGDLSQVYPIARGIAPMLISLGGYYFAGEQLSNLGWFGVFLVSFGIAMLSFARRTSSFDPRAVLAALATGVSIAGYSILDGLGARVSGDTLGFIGWLFVFEGCIAFGFLYYRRSVLAITPIKTYWVGLFGGFVSALAYGLVIYAKTLIALGAVSAMREASVIIASLIGIIVFKERPWKLRLLAAAIVAIGVFILATYAVSG